MAAVFISMDIQSLITFILFFSFVMSGGLAWYAANTYRTPGTKSYVGLMSSVALYCFGYALELNQTTLQGIFFALRIEYLGICFLPAFWVMLALQYTGYGASLPKWFYKSLFVLPVVTVILLNTNPWHHLHYSTFELNNSGPFPLVQFGKGIWYHVNIFYADVCFFVGNLLILRMVLRSVGRTRKQAATMFCASVIPWIGDFIYQAGLMPYNIDLVPITFSLVGPLFWLALFRFRMLDFVPIARHTVFDYVKDPVLVLDHANRLADFNKAAAGVFDTLNSNAIGKCVRDVLQDHPVLLRFLAVHHRRVKEVQIVCNGVYHEFELSVVLLERKAKQPQGKMVILHDITKLKQLLERLREQAATDGLTGIFNHRHFMEVSGRVLRQMSCCGHAVSLILVDLDYFKQINDTFGHLAGDEVLRSTASLFLDQLRETDIFGRYGGEEFIVFLPETDSEAAGRIAERLRTALAGQEIVSNGRKIRITGSFGVAECSGGEMDCTLKKLCGMADKALYRAKEKGRNRVEFSQEETPEAGGDS